MPLTYAFRLAVNEELSFCKDQGDDGNNRTVSLCSDLLEEQKATDDMQVTYWYALIGILLFVRIISTIFLYQRAKTNG